MDTYKVFVINDEGDDIQLERNIIAESLKDMTENLEIKYVSAKDSNAVAAALFEADAVISVYTKFDRETLEPMKNCKVIATQTIGVNSIDLDAATEFGICVSNVPDYCVEEVAVHTVSLALACLRKICTYDRISRQKVWNIDDIYKYGHLHRLQGQRYGILSFGNIGKRVAELIKPFGMEIMVYDPFLKDEIFKENDVQKAETLEELFSSCNIISIHTPLLPTTTGMINKDLLELMPEGSILINTSRGEIIHESELYDALKSGKLAAAGIDVIVDENTFETPLYELDNVIVTPHVAYYSEEALTECRVKAATMVADVIGRKCIPKYLVNKKVSGATREELITEGKL